MPTDPLVPDALRWRCDPSAFAFETTAELDAEDRVLGQDNAAEALRFGLAVRAGDQNVFVRGMRGTGRLGLVRRVCTELMHARRPRPDRVLVHHPARPSEPQLLTLAPGTARMFASSVEQLADWIIDEMPGALAAPDLKRRMDAIQEQANRELGAGSAPLEKELAEAGLALVGVQEADTVRPEVVPLIDGQPTSPDALPQLVAEGKLDQERGDALIAAIKLHKPRLHDLQEAARKAQVQAQSQARAMLEAEAAELLATATAPIRSAHPDRDAVEWLDSLVADLVAHGPPREVSPAERRRFLVNVLRHRSANAPAPLVVENHPTEARLLGSIDTTMLRDGTPVADHLTVQAGTILAADGGWLVIEAVDLLRSEGAWQALVRVLRAGWVEWEEASRARGPRPMLRPPRIPVEVRVVLLGTPEVYALLDAADPDFAALFKVVADLDRTLPRDAETLGMYAAVVARLCQKDRLLPFDPSAIARLAEHGARIADRGGRLTARFGRLNDIAREAAFVAQDQGAAVVTGAHVERTVVRTKARADLPARRYREAVVCGERRVVVQGTEVGQVNGLAVIHTGPLVYGFPTRITATVGAGSGGVVNIEGESALSGAIHTKGFHILGGLLRRLLPLDHPLCFDASIAFEQSYGGVDGDSASGVEFIGLLSALTGLPVRQDLAMTGAIDQVGSLMVIGAANEKVEGFYDVCAELGLTGTQGVLIPAANVSSLQLRADVVDAVRDGRFHVYATDSMLEAIELFFGIPAGPLGQGTVLEHAANAAHRLWAHAVRD